MQYRARRAIENFFVALAEQQSRLAKPINSRSRLAVRAIGQHQVISS